MPAPEREVQPQSSQAGTPSVSAVSMKDLLASCAAATAVSTPPRDDQAAEDDADDTEDAGPAAA
ncbi:hypothetical protein ACFTXO_14215 [Streptomyces sp. NPDC057067]|uniref:hypothetical protein n=1 Tax=Streptomyces TaxID=1883 RepID=UPI00192388D4|nr:hypothetical protein [Streptomyces silvae]MBL1291899.1 hypothetical protein [Streptomyces silvae]